MRSPNKVYPDLLILDEHLEKLVVKSHKAQLYN